MSKNKLFLMGLFLFLVLAAAHRASAQAHVIKIAVIDTGYTENGAGLRACDGHVVPEDIDPSGHGSNVAGIIAQSIVRSHSACFLIYKVFVVSEGKLKLDMIAYLKALNDAKEQGAVLVNISLAGQGIVIGEELLIKRLLDSKVTVVAAAGNGGINFDELICDKECKAGKKPKQSGCVINPACLDSRIFVIANLNSNTTNYGAPVDKYVNGNQITANGYTLTGTSQAAAVFSGKVLRAYLGME